MWNEFEGRRTYTGDGEPYLKIVKQRKLNPGDEVIIFKKKIGRKVVSQVSVQIRDDDNAVVVAERPQEPIVCAGSFVVFPYQIPGHIATNTFEVTKQDVAITLGKNEERVNGVRWTNEMGIQPEPSSSRLGRNFYETDTDSEALETKRKLDHWNKMAAEGKITGGRAGSGI